jgi:hypothetical protein
VHLPRRAPVAPRAFRQGAVAGLAGCPGSTRVTIAQTHHDREGLDRRCRMVTIFILLVVVLAQLAPAQAQVDAGCYNSHPCAASNGRCYRYRCGGYCQTSACSVSSCSRGEYLSSGSCRDCPDGRYQSSYSHSDSSCDRCSSGKYQSSTGSSSCRSCPSGKTSSTGSDSSSDCYSSGSSGTSGIDGDELADAAADAACAAIAEHGCKLLPECCGFVSRGAFPLASTRCTTEFCTRRARPCAARDLCRRRGDMSTWRLHRRLRAVDRQAHRIRHSSHPSGYRNHRGNLLTLQPQDAVGSSDCRGSDHGGSTHSCSHGGCAGIACTSTSTGPHAADAPRSIEASTDHGAACHGCAARRNAGGSCACTVNRQREGA